MAMIVITRDGLKTEDALRLEAGMVQCVCLLCNGPVWLEGPATMFSLCESCAKAPLPGVA